MILDDSTFPTDLSTHKDWIDYYYKNRRELSCYPEKTEAIFRHALNAAETTSGCVTIAEMARAHHFDALEI